MEQIEVILGVDTHLEVHVGAVISETGKLLGTRSASVDSGGYLDLLIWAKSFGDLRREVAPLVRTVRSSL
jgi:transposase